MKIIIISTGKELLRGIIADTNGAWMAATLDAAGFSVDRILIVDDDLEEMTRTLKKAFSSYDLTIVGGGLGPTDDDLTAEAAALAASIPLKHNESAEMQVRARFERIGREMAEINLKQALLPEGCEVLANPRGTAPGFALDTVSGRAVFLPGPPREMKPMFERYVVAQLPQAENRSRAVLRCFSRGESDVQAALKPLVEKHPDISWSYRATFPELVLTLTGPSEHAVGAARDATLEILGPAVFATEDIDLAAALGKILTEKSLTLATAESCTGGQIGHRITETPGSSAYFRGGIIAYDNDIKANVLGVNREILDTKGAVNQEVVEAMAAGARQVLDADVGIAVSGIAGPTGGTPDKPVGLVHIAVAHPGGIVHGQKTFTGYNRTRVKRISAWTAMWTAFRALKED